MGVLIYMGYVQDDMGWTPLMIAASVKDSEKLVVFLLSKGADPNEKSEFCWACYQLMGSSMRLANILFPFIQTTQAR